MGESGGVLSLSLLSLRIDPDEERNDRALLIPLDDLLEGEFLIESFILKNTTSPLGCRGELFGKFSSFRFHFTSINQT